MQILDSTLRDGAQAEGISFSVEDKIKIARALWEFGITFIEAGNPGSNQKDADFFFKAKKEPFFSSLCAFGSTRRKGVKPDDDKGLSALIDVGTETVCVFGKSWDFHAEKILGVSLDENLEIIEDTVKFLVSKGKNVIFDAEHFFDGYKVNPDYALSTLEVASNAGACCVCLCDTNGGTFPHEIYETVKKVCETVSVVRVGVHCHNDGGMAVANSIEAARAGATHIQGTFTGFGERTGNACLASIIPNLQLKLNMLCVPDKNIKKLTETARFVSEVANIKLNRREPFVGKSAFAHKGGMHIDGVAKASESFEHIPPETVGNERRILTSEVAGRGAILDKIRKFNPSAQKGSAETEQLIEQIKTMENDGYQFEAAEGSLELLVRKHMGKYKPLFELENFKIIGEQTIKGGKASSSAMIKVTVDGKEEITAAEGDGPVNALDIALRKALEGFYPNLKRVNLTDYKVRVLDGSNTTASKVRVLIESSDGINSWTTVGVSSDIIEASRIALADSIEYKLIRDIEDKYKAYL
ncbi:MAG: citramalate synthase [Clostridiales bacterium]|jgi:2-isopropylmalate synthase|nr:citramalate synthase [Clostridiales bacterium]